jgi:tRNA pseudouridine13 synthase
MDGPHLACSVATPMKVKQSPDDFQVEELTGVRPTPGGPFALYRLEKRGWSTPDALQAIRRRWQLDHRRLSYGGLKDRHALTVQYLTIFRGPQRGLTHHGIRLEYLGQRPVPYTSQDITANHFQIALRDLTPEKAARAVGALEELRVEGVPNYFDDQRFGSVGRPGEFVAREMVFGRFEEALRLALAGEYEHDRAEQKQEKAILLECWGDWKTCKERLPRGHARSLVDYLVHHPSDFRGAAARLRPDLQGLYLSAYQSHLWNRMLGRWLVQHCPADHLVNVGLRLGDVPMHRGLDESLRTELAQFSLPLPSARLKVAEDDPLRPIVESVMAEEGLRLDEMKIKGLRQPFFSRGERPALCLLLSLEHAVEPDDRHPGRQKLLLRFDLPRGSYATLIVKRVSQE